MAENTNHALVDLLFATRKELRRALEGLSAQDAERQPEGLNAVSWLVGHLASAEDAFFNVYCRNERRDEWVRAHYGPGDAPPPSFAEAVAAVERVHTGTESYLLGVTNEELKRVPSLRDGRTFRDESVTGLVRRAIAHEWLHIGELTTLRSLLGHKPADFPFNGPLPTEEPSPRNCSDLVDLLLRTRKELTRALDGLTAEDAQRQPPPGLNPVSWVIGHIAMGDHAYWNLFCRNLPRDEWITTYYRPGGAPVPPYAEAVAAVQRVHDGTEAYLLGLTDADLARVPAVNGRTLRDESVLRLMWRSIGHNWVHIGEINTLRSLYGHRVADFPFSG